MVKKGTPARDPEGRVSGVEIMWVKITRVSGHLRVGQIVCIDRKTGMRWIHVAKIAEEASEQDYEVWKSHFPDVDEETIAEQIEAKKEAKY